MNNTETLQFSGRKLAEARKRKGLRQEELGRIINKSRFVISSYERDDSKPPADQVLMLLDALDVSPKDLST